LIGGKEAATGVAFSHDGRTLASSGSDSTVRLWDVRARRALGAPLSQPAGPQSSVAFSGGVLVTASIDEVLLWDPILWSGDRRALTERVCDAVGRDLTRAEWAQFVPSEPYHETCA
jgi:WD40 repeat protein